MSDVDAMVRYLRTRLDAVVPDTLSAFADELDAIVQWIRAIDQLPPPLRSTVMSTDTPDGPDRRGAEAPTARSPAAAAEPAPRGDEFRRDLRGGILWPSGIRVPEVWVRDQQLCSGDRVTYQPISGGGEPLYRFHLESRGRGEEPRVRIQRSLAMVEREAGVLVVRRTASDGALTQPVVLLPYDVAKFELKVGDLVDLAYWADDPDTVRVCWRHHMDALDGDGRPGPGHSPGAGKADKPKVKKAPPEPVLAGKRVLVIGNEPRQRQYHDAIAQRGGAMEWLSGDESEDRLAAAIGRVDAVVVLKAHCSHHASETAVALGKLAQVPVRRIGADGIKSVADWAVKLTGSSPDDLWDETDA